MAHYAFINENNVVVEVIVGIDETELIEGVEPEIWYSEFRGMRCKRTSYNSKIRGVFAAIGYSYLEDEDIFVIPQPFQTWIRNGSIWEPPIPYPTDGQFYGWNEESQSWISDAGLK